MIDKKATRFRRLFRRAPWVPLGLSAALSCAMVLVLETVGPTQATAQDPRNALLWRAKCSSCHGIDGRGQTKQGVKLHVPDMSTATWQQGKTDAQIQTTIENGVDEVRNGIQVKMDAFRTKLQPAQIQALVQHIRGLRR